MLKIWPLFYDSLRDKNESNLVFGDHVFEAVAHISSVVLDDKTRFLDGRLRTLQSTLFALTQLEQAVSKRFRVRLATQIHLLKSNEHTIEQ